MQNWYDKVHKEKNQKSFLRHIIKEIYEKLDAGYEIDKSKKKRAERRLESDLEITNKKFSSVELNEMLKEQIMKI